MSATERGKQKQQVEVSEEEDFEIFVRKSLGQLSKGQKHNFTLALVSEQYNYDTRSASLQHPNPSSFRTNIRKFCPTVMGSYYWNDIPYLYVKRQLKIPV